MGSHLRPLTQVIIQDGQDIALTERQWCGQLEQARWLPFALRHGGIDLVQIIQNLLPTLERNGTLIGQAERARRAIEQSDVMECFQTRHAFADG